LRVPAAPIPVAVIHASGLPITATSANLSGATECTTAEEVHDQLRGRLNIIIDGGRSPREVASTIIDLSGDQGIWSIQREGAIPSQEVQKALSEALGAS